jgi:four helix bundle protein
LSSIERFEDLTAWTKARSLGGAVYRATKKGDFSKDFGLAGQTQRAAVCIMSNIAEGFERRTASEFSQFLTVAKASCAELRSQLYLAYDIGYLNKDEFTHLLAQAEEVARIVGGLRASVERKRNEKK